MNRNGTECNLSSIMKVFDSQFISSDYPTRINLIFHVIWLQLGNKSLKTYLNSILSLQLPLAGGHKKYYKESTSAANVHAKIREDI